jgi:streptogramin lyase
MDNLDTMDTLDILEISDIVPFPMQSRQGPRYRLLAIALVLVVVLFGVTLLRLSATRLFPPSAKLFAQSSIIEYPLPEGAQSLVAGPDGNIWLSNGAAIEAWSIDGTPLAAYQISTRNISSSRVIVGSDRNIWFIERKGDKVGTISEGHITEYPIPGDEGILLAAGDGFLWFTSFVAQTNSYMLGKMSLNGQVTMIPVGQVSIGGIAVGMGNSLWFAETDAQGRHAIMHIASDGALLAAYPASSEPNELIYGADGNLWFADTTASNIAILSPATGTVKEYPITSLSQPTDLIWGPDGAVWFGVVSSTHGAPIGNTIGRMSPKGDFSTMNVPGAVLTLALGPDGNFWFVDTTHHALGVLTFGL